MVIDTSAMVAILLGEPERSRFNALIGSAAVRLTSAATRVEVTLVIEGRKGDAGRVDLEQYLGEAGIEVVAVTPAHAELACEAFRRFGKGRHRAGLNFGDCFAYALTKAMGEPLLCKGDDFIRTDVMIVT